MTGLSRIEVLSQKAITTKCWVADIRTGVGIDLITIIALLTLLLFTVPAVLTSTGIRAAVVVDVVAIITGLKACCRILYIGSLNSITANRQSTGVPASIRIFLVAIVTGFVVRIKGVVDIIPCNAVTATGDLTGIQAGVRVDGVAIIALLPFVQHAITAALVGTDRRTAIAVDEVAVITGLVTILPSNQIKATHIITANSVQTPITAGIRIRIVTVVALLIALLARR